MKFLSDVHISYKVVKFLLDAGFESIHVNNILDRWHTKDEDICNYADVNDLIVITKDSDFKDSYFIKGTPKKLIKINLGNISNSELQNIIAENISAIRQLNDHSRFLMEIDKDHSITFVTG